MTIQRIDTPDGRFYGKQKYPSVTTLLDVLGKPALIPWAATQERNAAVRAAALTYQKYMGLLIDGEIEIPTPDAFQKDMLDAMGPAKAHQKILKEAADIGTQVHHRAEWTLKTELGITPGKEPLLTHPKAEESWTKWLQWRAQVNLKPLAIELRLVSHVFGYGGTLDLVAEVDGQVTVIDFKTGKAIYAESYLQNAAYRLALEEMGQPTKRGIIVRLPKEVEDPDFEAGEVPPLEELTVPFLALIPIWRWLNGQKKQRKAKKNVSDAAKEKVSDSSELQLGPIQAENERGEADASNEAPPLP